MTETSLWPSAAGETLYRTILVGTGGAAHSQIAVERAALLARHYGAALHVVTVVPQAGHALLSAAAAFPGGEMLEAQAHQGDYAQREEYLRATAEQLRAQGIHLTGHLRPALKPADAILQVAQEVGADLIVLGRKHKSAWSAALAGSVSDMVSHASPVDVLVVR